jgi:hypothetical protein
MNKGMPIVNSDAREELGLWYLTPLSTFSWQSVLLGEETGVPGENYIPVACHCQTLLHVVSSTPRHKQDSNGQL